MNEGYIIGGAVAGTVFALLHPLSKHLVSYLPIPKNGSNGSLTEAERAAIFRTSSEIVELRKINDKQTDILERLANTQAILADRIPRS